MEKDWEPQRQLITTFSTKAGNFKLTIRTSLINGMELAQIVLFNVIMPSLVLFICLVYTNKKLLQKLWRPFYATLDLAGKYRLDQPHEIYFPDTNITEFRELNETLDCLIKNSLRSFQDQKHFTENASHEIQTPLAIARNKAELLMQDPDLTAAQAELVHSLEKNLSRLSKLNKSLLLLSKIPNNQFPSTQKICVSESLEKQIDDLKDLMAFMNISIEKIIKGNAAVEMNPELAEILFGNLVGNAIHHNTQNGMITLIVDENSIQIENTGLPFSGDTEILFQRFKKSSTRQDSYGLGLSIVKSICDFYRFSISYSVQGNNHKFSIHF